MAIEIWGDLNGNGIPDSNEDDGVTLKNSNSFVRFIAILSSVSIVVPYILNLLIAANIKKLIRENNAAKAYFQNSAAIFTLFVVMSGGAYPALAVVSSNIFSLSIFNSGLTHYELKKLSKIKLFGTIILENLPQLVCQILYSYVVGYPSQTTQLAFTASLLSVLASTLSYWIEKNSADTTAVEYYLSFECAQKRTTNDDKGLSTFNKRGELIPAQSAGNTEDIFDENGKKIEKLGITKDEKELFSKNKGLKSKLSGQMAQIFGISESNIEIGYVQITKYGIIMHIVHYVYSTDIEELEDALHDEEEMNISIGRVPAYFCEQLHLGNAKEINQVFREHFKMQNADFSVCYSKRYPKNDKKSKGNLLDDDDDDASPPSNDRRAIVMKKMKTRLPKIIGEGLIDDSQTIDEIYGGSPGDDVELTPYTQKQSDIKKKLNKVLSKYEFDSNVQKRDFLMQWIGNEDEQKLQYGHDDDGDDDEYVPVPPAPPNMDGNYEETKEDLMNKNVALPYNTPYGATEESTPL